MVAAHWRCAVRDVGLAGTALETGIILDDNRQIFAICVDDRGLALGSRIILALDAGHIFIHFAVSMDVQWAEKHKPSAPNPLKFHKKAFYNSVLVDTIISKSAYLWNLMKLFYIEIYDLLCAKVE